MVNVNESVVTFCELCGNICEFVVNVCESVVNVCECVAKVRESANSRPIHALSLRAGLRGCARLCEVAREVVRGCARRLRGGCEVVARWF